MFEQKIKFIFIFLNENLFGNNKNRIKKAKKNLKNIKIKGEKYFNESPIIGKEVPQIKEAKSNNSIIEILDFKILIMNLDKIFEEWQNNNHRIMEKIKRKVKNEKIIEAFLKVPRNLFVENEPFEDIAVYYDLGQTSSQPSLIAEMLELLEIKKDDKVLEIGTGSGYLTALLCELSYFVYSIDIFQEFIIRADEKLKLLNYKNYKLFVRDGNYGLEEFSPYDKIIVSAYVETIPISLLEQLNLEGIMVIPVGKKNFQHLYKIIKYEAVSFVPLLNTLKF